MGGTLREVPPRSLHNATILASSNELAMNSWLTSENLPSSTTSLTTGEPAEKSYIEWFVEGKRRSLRPILSLSDSNSRNIQLHFLLI